MGEIKKKASYIGSPACFKLELACQQITQAFGHDGHGCYVVGSALEKPDWRDVDVRLILPDDEFAKLFPSITLEQGRWEFDPRWILLSTCLSNWLTQQTGLPVDFQFQPQSHANARHQGIRHAIGINYLKAQ